MTNDGLSRSLAANVSVRSGAFPRKPFQRVRALLGSAAILAGSLGSVTIIGGTALVASAPAAFADCVVTTGGTPDTINCVGADTNGVSQTGLAHSIYDDHGAVVTIGTDATVTNTGGNHTSIDLTLGNVFSATGGDLVFNQMPGSGAVSGAGTQVNIGSLAYGTQVWTIGSTISSTGGNAIVDKLGIGGNVDMTISPTGTVSAANNAVTIFNGIGTLNVDLQNRGTVNAGNNGISITASVISAGVSSINLDNSGTIGTQANAIGGTAVSINMLSLNPNSTVTVTNDPGSNQLAGAGTIYAVGNAVSVNQAVGAMSVTNAGGITSTAGTGLALNMGIGTVDIANKAGGTITADDDAVNVFQTAGTTTVQNDGTIHAGGVGINVLNLAGSVSVVNTSLNSIDALTGGMTITAGGDIDITNQGGAVNVTGTGPGIQATSVGGNVVINGDENATHQMGTVTTNNGEGIVGTALLGDTTIVAGTTTANGGVGVVGVAGGDATVTTEGVTRVTNGQFGVAAIAGDDATINIHDNVTYNPFTNAGPAVGGAAIAQNGDATINVGHGVTVGGTDLGLLGLTFGGGDVDINANHTTVVSGGAGIVGAALNGGDVDIDSDRVVALGGSGVFGYANGGDVDIDAHGNIIANGFAGIGAVALGGDADIDFEHRTITNFGGAGVVAFATDGNVDLEGRRSDVYAAGDGITGTAVNGNVWIDSNHVVAFGGSGVLGTAFGGNVDIDAHGDIFANGLTGIGAFAAGGDASIDFEHRQISNIGGDGVVAFAAGGDVDLEGRRSSVHADQNGITGTAIDGNVWIDSGRVTAYGGNGVVGTAFGGNVDIDAHGNISANGFAGVGAFAYGGDADIDIEGRHITNDAGDGVVAFALNGNVDIEGRWSRVNAEGTGIDATAVNGNVWIDTGRINAVFGNGVTGTAYGGDVDIDVHNDIHADNGVYGAAATAYGGNATVTVGGEIDPPLIGAMATTYGSGTATVHVNANIDADIIGALGVNHGSGNVVVDTTADIAAGLTGIQTVNTGAGTTTIDIDGDIGGLFFPATFGDGVNAYAAYGAGLVDAELHEGRSILALGDGFDITHLYGTGGVTANVDANAFVFAGHDGINIHNTGGTGGVTAGVGDDALIIAFNDGVNIHQSAVGAVQVSVGTGGGVLAAFGHAIDVDAATHGADDAVTINNDGFLLGAGTLAGSTVHVRSDGLATINNNANGTIVGLNALRSQVVIDVDGVGDDGKALINNDGLIVGRVALTDNADVFNNNSANSWHTTGDSYFGAGYDQINNNGTISAIGITRLLGLETLDNNATGVVTMLDGDALDELTTGGAYDGATGAILAIDAALQGPGLDAADLFRITGNASGTTAIAVNNLTPGPATYDPNGVLVVNAGTSTNGDGTEFNLLGGPIDAGLFTYDLHFDAPNNDWYLLNAPNDTAFELATITSLAQHANSAFATTWHDRTDDLRDDPETADGGGGVWFRAFGDRFNRTVNSTAVSNGPVDFTTDFAGAMQQTTAGITGGADKIIDTHNGSLVVGLLGNYTSSRGIFDATGTTNEMTGGGAGAYMTLLNGGLFIDVLAQAQFDKFDYTAGGDMPDNATTTGRTYGLIADGGYRFGTGTLHVEPLATFAYSRTTVDEMTLLGNDVSFSGGSSALGRLGLRFAATFSAGTATIEPFVEASAWHEFLGTNSATISGGGTGITLDDDTAGTTYRAVGGIEFHGAGALSGFLTGQYTFGEGTTGYGAQGGVRFGF